MSDMSEGWEVGPVPGRGLRSRKNGHFELPLQVLRPRGGGTSLVLTVVEAEQLHAALCYALDGEPAPADAPDCRKPIRSPGGRK
jgi:hypothetical protein